MTDIAALWKFLKDSNGSSVTFKFFEKDGDALPFRAIIMVQGVDEVANVCAAVDEVTTPIAEAEHGERA